MNKETKEKILVIFVQYMEIARDPELSRSSVLSGFESELDEILNALPECDGKCPICKTPYLCNCNYEAPKD